MPGIPSNDRPSWAPLVLDRQEWRWEGTRLVQEHLAPSRPVQGDLLRRLLVSNLYATQNRSRAVKAALGNCLRALAPPEWGLNLGSGSTRIHPRVINLDISDVPEVDIVASGDRIPFHDESLALVVAQEVLEHTPDPFAVCAEVQRVLRRGGLFYLQVPFQIGWHSGPKDYWRFSDDAIRELLDGEGWNLLELGYSLGYGSGFYRIAVEYAAITASLVARPLYLPAKAMAALLFVPFRWVDGLTRFSPEGRRIAGGFFAVASKR